MGLTWTAWALPGLLTVVLAWTGVVVVLRTAPHRSLNRRLAVLLFLEGLWLGSGVFYMIEDPGVAYPVGAVAVAAMATLPFQYLSFLGASLRTPLVRPFRSGTAVLLLGLAGAGAALWVLLSPSSFITELYSPSWATWNFRFRPMGQRAAQVLGVAALFGLIAALHAYRNSSPGSAARNRAKWFAIAFGIRDVYVGVANLLYPVVRDTPLWGDFIYNAGQVSVYLVYLLLLTYGVLRTQLFDIDLKVKFALEQSTVGAFFAGAFFAGDYLLQRIIPVEGVVLGFLASAAIALALRPIQRFAEGFANRVMGDVEDTAEYIRARKHTVYRAALEGAVEDGLISDRERAILRRLREQLDISADTGRELEQEVVSREDAVQ